MLENAQWTERKEEGKGQELKKGKGIEKGSTGKEIAIYRYRLVVWTLCGTIILVYIGLSS